MPEDLSPEDVARMDRKAYREPERDLEATKPAAPGEEGARGDVRNPLAETWSHGAPGPDQDTVGSDERAFLANRKTPRLPRRD